jgi:thiosulfate/3-mercaptopyruvate sulfurtransferase
MHTTLITVAELMDLQQRGAPLMLMDCSFDLMNPAKGHQDFESQHIPGSIHVDLNQDLSAHGDSSASGGRHPLPTREAFAQRLRALGVTNETQVVVLDRQGANYCGRLWWMLKWCGHEAVAVLDGGLGAWVAAGGAVQSGPATAPTPAAPPFELKPSLAPTASTQDIAAALGKPGQTLIDARAGARFRGEVEPLDPVAGHIPGALNRPFTDNIGPDGRFKPAEQLRAEFAQLLGGRDPATVVHHCGSGVSAIPNLLAMELAGLGRSALYPGSWSEWCNTPGLPCARNSGTPGG